MKQFTIRLSDEQFAQYELIKKRCFFKSNQQAFEKMVENYLNYYEDYPVLIAENKNLSFEMLNLAKTHDQQIDLLCNIIVKATKSSNVQQEETMEY